MHVDVVGGELTGSAAFVVVGYVLVLAVQQVQTVHGKLPVLHAIAHGGIDQDAVAATHGVGFLQRAVRKHADARPGKPTCGISLRSEIKAAAEHDGDAVWDVVGAVGSIEKAGMSQGKLGIRAEPLRRPPVAGQLHAVTLRASAGFIRASIAHIDQLAVTLQPKQGQCGGEVFHGLRAHTDLRTHGPHEGIGGVLTGTDTTGVIAMKTGAEFR